MRKHISSIVVVVVLMLALSLSGTAAAKYNEAPVLKKLVEEGKLPPVEERLPEDPLVVEPLESIGKYGGTWRKLETHHFMYHTYEPLVKRRPTDLVLMPNLATEWTVSEDKTTFTFKLRKGIKWSDGEPFTSEDVLFWYEDIVCNKDMNPAMPSYLTTADGEAAEIIAPDKWTIIFKFKAPQPFFMDKVVATEAMGGPRIHVTPKHYLKQFHPKYADPDQLAKEVKEAGMETWYQLLGQKMDHRTNPDLPTLAAWKLVTDPKQQVQIAERNPYYWKVDPAGNQLPYIDKLVWQNITEPEVKLLKALAGEVDLAQVGSILDMPVLKKNEASGGYETLLTNNSGVNGAGIMLYVNQNYQDDEEIGELLRNVQFRRALSVAINRHEVNEFTYLGLAPERQAVLSELHPAGSEEFAKAYTEYDPEKASKWLDEIGLDKRDKDGYRLLPSGKPFTLILSPYGTEGARVDAAEIIKRHFEAVGIKTAVRPAEGSLWLERVTAGKHHIAVYANSNGMQPFARPLWYFPITDRSYWAPLYGLYYSTDGQEGIKPEGLQQRLIEIYEAALEEVDEEKRIELAREAMKLHAENLWQIGIVGYGPGPVVKSKKMKNVPKEFVIAGWNPYTVFPEQYYFDE